MSFCSKNIRTALTHRSWSSENGGEDYEKLEFLGDAVLQLAVTQLLFESFPNADEGSLSKMRHKLVNNERLSTIAKSLQIGPLLTFGKGEIARNGHQNPKILANAFEAIVGAIYLDCGIGQVRSIVDHHFRPFLTDANRPNPKSKLHEWIQKQHKTLPTYSLISKSGPAHNLRFTMSVAFNGQTIATGEGRSKHLATKAAAVNALKTLGLDE